MRGFVVVTVTAVLAGGALALAADEGLPVLAAPEKILADGKPIAVNVGHAAPLVLDFNHDGKKDLIVGQFFQGKARVYLNVGTDAAPIFSKFDYLQADGADAAVPPS